MIKPTFWVCTPKLEAFKGKGWTTIHKICFDFDSCLEQGVGLDGLWGPFQFSYSLIPWFCDSIQFTFTIRPLSPLEGASLLHTGSPSCLALSWGDSRRSPPTNTQSSLFCFKTVMQSSRGIWLLLLHCYHCHTHQGVSKQEAFIQRIQVSKAHASNTMYCTVAFLQEFWLLFLTSGEGKFYSG